MWIGLVEKALILSDQPEWNAVNNIIRSNEGLPEIDVNNPIYQYQMSDRTIKLGNTVRRV